MIAPLSGVWTMTSERNAAKSVGHVSFLKVNLDPAQAIAEGGRAILILGAAACHVAG